MQCWIRMSSLTVVLQELVPGMKSVIAKQAGAKADVLVENGEKVSFGKHSLEVRSTPGHTDGCVTYVLNNGLACFTGDAVLIRGCGRTDFQAGDPAKLYESVHTQVFTLPDDCVLYPAHDYKGHSSSTVQEEKTLNPRCVARAVAICNYAGRCIRVRRSARV